MRFKRFAYREEKHNRGRLSPLADHSSADNGDCHKRIHLKAQCDQIRQPFAEQRKSADKSGCRINRICRERLSGHRITKHDACGNQQRGRNRQQRLPAY
jgi:hypothetical protein